MRQGWVVVSPPLSALPTPVLGAPAVGFPTTPPQMLSTAGEAGLLVPLPTAAPQPEVDAGEANRGTGIS